MLSIAHNEEGQISAHSPYSRTHYRTWTLYYSPRPFQCQQQLLLPLLERIRTLSFTRCHQPTPGYQRFHYRLTSFAASALLCTATTFIASLAVFAILLYHCPSVRAYSYIKMLFLTVYVPLQLISFHILYECLPPWTLHRLYSAQYYVPLALRYKNHLHMGKNCICVSYTWLVPFFPHWIIR